jgi:hypothetical protein
VNQHVPINPVERKEQADQAYALINDKIFQKALTDLQKRYQDEFMGEQSAIKRDVLWAKMNMLEDFPRQLASYINSERMAQQRRK